MVELKEVTGAADKIVFELLVKARSRAWLSEPKCSVMRRTDLPVGSLRACSSLESGLMRQVDPGTLQLDVFARRP